MLKFPNAEITQLNYLVDVLTNVCRKKNRGVVCSVF